MLFSVPGVVVVFLLTAEYNFVEFISFRLQYYSYKADKDERAAFWLALICPGVSASRHNHGAFVDGHALIDVGQYIPWLIVPQIYSQHTKRGHCATYSVEPALTLGQCR
jgi:hypothetical protein